MSDSFCLLDYSAGIKTLASHIDRQQNIWDSPQDETRIRDGYQHEHASKEGHKCYGRCQVTWKKVIDYDVVGKPVLNSSVRADVKKADGCMQDCFQHLVVKMFAGVRSDPKGTKRADDSKDHSCTGQWELRSPTYFQCSFDHLMLCSMLSNF